MLLAFKCRPSYAGPGKPSGNLATGSADSQPIIGNRPVEQPDVQGVEIILE